MAEIFAAKLYGTDGFEKDIVIKQILPQYARDPEFVQSFVAEAKIAVTLSHANIVGIYELGRVDGTYFIAMEYVDGLDVFSLADAARRHGERVNPGDALYIVEEVAKGLDYAHRRLGPDGLPLGLVHRDLSPRNVLISREGEVKILDFGIAKTHSETADLMPKTRAGVVKGTTGYMSPEQAVGLDIDGRTDVYQAGLLLFELLAGKPLFWRPDEEETRELMRRHEVVAPSSLAPGLPRELDEVVFDTLARNPGDRIATAHELAVVMAHLRQTYYPAADARALGSQVSRLLNLEDVASKVSASILPSTHELSAVSAGREVRELRGNSKPSVPASPVPQFHHQPGEPPLPDDSDDLPMAAALASPAVAPVSALAAPTSAVVDLLPMGRLRRALQRRASKLAIAAGVIAIAGAAALATWAMSSSAAQPSVEGRAEAHSDSGPPPPEPALRSINRAKTPTPAPAAHHDRRKPGRGGAAGGTDRKR